jgi:hypothetical protein
MKKAFLSPSAAARVDRAAAWLCERSPCEQILIVTANREAASEIVRRKVLESRGGAAFGWHRATVGRLAAEIARDGRDWTSRGGPQLLHPAGSRVTREAAASVEMRGPLVRRLDLQVDRRAAA